MAAAGIAVAMFSAPAATASTPSWNFEQAQVPAAQPLGLDGRGVLVAVVDTWVDFNDQEFAGRVVDEVDCQAANGAPSACRDHTYAPDQCTHGTHVAGTVASNDYGVAPAADILAVEVLAYDSSNGDCDGNPNDVAAGIDWAASHGAKVINLSVGDSVPLFFQSSEITDAIASAAAAGVVVVVAAGNSGTPFTDNYGSNAVMVAATGPSGQLASYSNSFTLPAGAVGIAAPGGDSGSNDCSVSDCVLSTLPGNQTGLMEGTSMATPHVAGTAALLFARDPSLTRTQVINALTSTATPLAGAGSGALDAAAAVRSVPQSAPTTAPKQPENSLPAPALPSPATHDPTLSDPSPPAPTTAPYSSPLPARLSGGPRATTSTTVIGLPPSPQVIPERSTSQKSSIRPSTARPSASSHVGMDALAAALLAIVGAASLATGRTLRRSR